MLKYILLFGLLFCKPNIQAQAQNILKGHVFEQTKNNKLIPLIGANVYWAGTTIGTTTDPNGEFNLRELPPLPAKLVVRYIGFQTDTLLINEPGIVKAVLQKAVDLKEVSIEGRQQSTIINTIDPILTEHIGAKELLKAACCNLSESFETNASVDVSYSDAVTGAKEIQMLGLSGTYTQIQTENIPSLRGLGQTYGLSYIPGPWMESIQVTKGTGSVLNGYESMAGQINIEYLKPWEADKFYINLYGASTTNTELNTYLTHKLNKNWSTMTLLHAEAMQKKWDKNGDGFLSMPLMKQINMMNRWNYQGDGRLESQFGIKALFEDRLGGQSKFDPDKDRGTTNAYGIGIKTARLEGFTKTGLVNYNHPERSIGWINNFTFHDQSAYFGLKEYEATQKSFYSNLIFQDIFKNTFHKYRLGLSMIYDDLLQKVDSINYSGVETVPGIFAEYTDTHIEKFTLVAGIRGDLHSTYGFKVTPRIHLKYDLKPESVIRLSAGTGFRSPNIFADNLGILSSSRKLVVLEEINAEESFTYGISFTHKFILAKKSGAIVVDYFHTDFMNQLITDTYSDPTEIRFYNLKGKSFSNSFQAQINYELVKKLDIKAAYRFDDVKSTYGGLLLQKALHANHKTLVNLAYETRFDKWKFDLTWQWTGPKKLTDSSHGSDALISLRNSPAYSVIHSQVTRNFKKWSLYAGVENLLDKVQHNAIVNPENPFSEKFDATQVWGPLMGRKVYAGFRLTIK